MEILEQYTVFFGSNPQSSAGEKLYGNKSPKKVLEKLNHLHYWARLNAQLGLFILGIWNAMHLLSVATKGSRKTVVKSGYQAVRQTGVYLFTCSGRTKVLPNHCEVYLSVN